LAGLVTGFLGIQPTPFFLHAPQAAQKVSLRQPEAATPFLALRWNRPAESQP
jgi:hypothetical protein